MTLLMSDWRIFHWLPILKAGSFPALRQRQMVWLDTPKNLANSSTFMILSVPVMDLAYHCESLISSAKNAIFYGLIKAFCIRGETDITTVFGTVIGGSIPSGCTR